MNESMPNDEGQSEDEPDVSDANLPSDEDEAAAPLPDDDSVTPVDPDLLPEAGKRVTLLDAFSKPFDPVFGSGRPFAAEHERTSC